MLICKDKLYIDSHSIGPFKVYMALEDAENVTNIVKVVDLTRDAYVYLTSEAVIPFNGNLDDELREVANKYNHTI